MGTRQSFAVATVVAALALVACGESEECDDLAACGAPPEAEQVTIPGGGEALVWGRGRDAVLLAHGAAFDASSWTEQASVIAASGKLVVALEDIAPEDILAASDYLRDQRSASSIALIGASAGADASLQALAAEPAAFDQLITLSVNSEADGLGREPKLFIASEDEPVADFSTSLAESSTGTDNEALIVPGSAHAQAIFDGDQGERALNAILERLGAPA